MLGHLTNKIRSLAGFRSRAVLARGTVRGASESLRLLYIGNGTNLAFVVRSAFGDEIQQQSLGDCNIWNGASIADRYADDVDMVVFDVPWPYEIDCPTDAYVVELPAWIRQEVTLARTWNDTIARFHKNVRGSQLRKIRKHALTYTTSNSLADADRFYDEMYVPHTRNRYGAEARFDSKKSVRNCVRKGTLLKISRNGDTVAACVLIKRGGKLHMPFNGFSTSDFRTIDGASAAMYFYTLKYAFDQGCDSVNLLGSRPMLDDGVYRTKRSWGASIYDDWSLESLLLSFKRWSPGVRRFLAANPLLTRDYDQLSGKVLIEAEPLTAELAKKTAHRLRCPNMDDLKVFALRGVSDDASIDTSVDTRVHLIDLLHHDDPLRVYCDG